MRIECPILKPGNIDILSFKTNEEDKIFFRSRQFRKFFHAAVTQIDNRNVTEGRKGDAIYLIPRAVVADMESDKIIRNKYLQRFKEVLPRKVSGLFLLESQKLYVYYIWDKKIEIDLREPVDFKLSCACFVGTKFAGYEEMTWCGETCSLHFSYVSLAYGIKKGKIAEDTTAFIGLTERCKVQPAYYADARWADNIYIVTAMS